MGNGSRGSPEVGDGQWVEWLCRGGWAMAPLLPLGWGWVMAVLFGQGLYREGCGPHGMY